MTREKIDRLVREPWAVASVSVLVMGAAFGAATAGYRPSPLVAGWAAACALGLLSVLSFLHARRHAEPDRTVYWPGFVFSELLAVGAAWAIWWMRAKG